MSDPPPVVHLQRNASIEGYETFCGLFIEYVGEPQCYDAPRDVTCMDCLFQAKTFADACLARLAEMRKENMREMTRITEESGGYDGEKGFGELFAREVEDATKAALEEMNTMAYRGPEDRKERGE